MLDELGARQRVRMAQNGALAPLWTELASARQRLANIVVRGPNDQRPGQYAALVEDASAEQRNRRDRQLAEQSAAFSAELKKDGDRSRARASGVADRHGAVVSIVRFNRTMFEPRPGCWCLVSTFAKCSRTIPSYVAFVLRPGTDTPAVVPLGRADHCSKR